MDRVRISVCLVTYNRVRFLVRCLEALGRTLPGDSEVIVWDNGSTDETPRCLREWIGRLRFDRPEISDRIRVHSHSRNIGVDAYPESIRRTTGAYIVLLDDDVIELPEGWAEQMIVALERVPDLGLVSLDVVQDERTQGGKPGPSCYRRVDYGGGLILDFGPAGGWCCMTTRRIYDRVGGLPQMNRPYYHHDGIYSERLRAQGYRTAILAGWSCYHACDEKWAREMGYEEDFRKKRAQLALMRGDRARGQWQFQEAISAYREALQWDPNVRGVRVRMADCCFMLEQYEEADRHLRAAHEEGEELPLFSYVQAMKALREGHVDRARGHFQEWAKQVASDEAVARILSRVNLFSKRIEPENQSLSREAAPQVSWDSSDTTNGLDRG